MDQLRKGDVLVVWKLDRLSCSLRDALTIIERLAEAKAGFRSLTKGYRHHHPGRTHDDADGESFAEAERAILRERIDGQMHAVDSEGRHWVRFDVRRVTATEDKPHGLD